MYYYWGHNSSYGHSPLQLDEFLAKMESPDYWRTVKDPVTGRDVVLTDEQLDLIKKIESSEFPEQTGDPYEVRRTRHTVI